jgi:iron complex transport system substrate-binding protein
MPARATLPLLLLALLTSSCGFKHEPLGALPAFPQTVRDALNRQIVIDKAPKRIVSLDPGMTAALFAIGAGNVAVGGSGTETYPASAAALPAMLDPDGSIDTKAIRRALPDIVLIPASLAPTGDDAKRLQVRLSAVVYVVRATTVSGVERDIGELGLMTGHADQARVAVAKIQTGVDAVHKAVAAQPLTPTFVDIGFRYTIDPATIPADLIRLAQGQNVAAAADPSKLFSVSELTAAAPQVYLSVAGQGATLSELHGRKSLAALPAVQQKRVIAIPQTTLYEDGPRLARALATIAKALHPGITIPTP